MNIEHDNLRQNDFDDVIKDFADAKACKVPGIL